MGVGAAEAEGVDADHQAALGLQGVRLGHHLEVPLVELDGRIELADADGGRHLAVPQAIERLGQAGDAGGGLKVADVALHRADGQRRLALLGQGLADGTGLDGVAHRGAGAVSFQVVDLVRGNAGLLVGLTHQRDLCAGVGHGETGLVTIGVDRGAGHHGEDAVAVGHCLVVLLEQEEAGALGAHIAIAVRVEHLAAPGSGEHARLGEDDEAVGVQVQADAAGQRHVDLAGADRLARLVEGHQRRGAGGIQRHAGSMQVEYVGEPVRGDTRGVAGGS